MLPARFIHKRRRDADADAAASSARSIRNRVIAAAARPLLRRSIDWTAYARTTVYSQL